MTAEASGTWTTRGAQITQKWILRQCKLLSPPIKDRAQGRNPGPDGLARRH